MSQVNLFAEPQRLRRLQIEITTGCNLRCVGCQRTIGMASGTWRNAHMPVQRFASVIANAPQADAIVLQGIGEPTLHPKLPDLIAAARATGKFGVISFNTNALAREIDYYRHLRQIGLNHISVSVDSLDPVTAEALRAGTDAAELRAAIPALLGLFSGLTLSIVLSRRNITELPDLVTRLHELGARVIEIQPLVSYAPSTEAMALDRTELRSAAATIAALRQRLPGLTLLPAAALTPDGSRCRRPFRAAYVTVGGFLTPCCLTNDPDLFGRVNLAEVSFQQAWHTPGVRRFLESYFDEEPEICRGCAFNPSGATAPAPAVVAEAQRQQQAGQLDRAEAGYRAALDSAQSGEALQGLGLARFQRGDAAGALPLLQAADALAPTPRLTHNIATVLAKLGRLVEATALQWRNVTEHPEYVASYHALSALLEASGDRGGAAGVALSLAERAIPGGQEAIIEAAVGRAAGLDPGHAALVRVANRLRIAGHQTQALRLLDARLTADPADLGARLSRAMARLAVVHGSEAEVAERRAAYSAEIGTLAGQVARADAVALVVAAEQVGTAKPFYLAYQGYDDRALQAAYGGIVSRMMSAHVRAENRPIPVRRAGRIRVGFATAYMHLHSISKLFGGWVRHLDRDRFDVTLYHLGEGQDAMSADLANHADRFHVGPADEQEWVRRIAGDALDVLIYPEIGMHPTAVRLACLRLAPVQCVAWGHPVTTGLPTMDYFLSSDLMEPEDGDRHYTERLIRLPNLSIHYEPLPDHPGRITRSTLGVADDAVVYVCCQSLFKYHPRDDAVLVAIAGRVPVARFLFIGDPRNDPNARLLRTRLGAAFAASGLDPARHLLFVPPVDASDFFSLLRAGDVYLDSIGWSGGNTTLEAVTCGLPIVTLRGKLMRGRHSAAILTVVGAADRIAETADDYVRMAADLADPAARSRAARVIKEGGGRAFRDRAPVRALETFLTEAVIGASNPSRVAA
jgi:predicted O-linked N-acetylglucosamine transferase (SPINDLY family)/MoaA/NifB/PqqE/SkfB family radical SAM enzyme